VRRNEPGCRKTASSVGLHKRLLRSLEAFRKKGVESQTRLSRREGNRDEAEKGTNETYVSVVARNKSSRVRKEPADYLSLKKRKNTPGKTKR